MSYQWFCTNCGASEKTHHRLPGDVCPNCSDEDYPVLPMDVVEENINLRESVLTEAIGLINGDRNNQYGEPQDDFGCTAEFWTTYLNRAGFDLKGALRPHDVAIMMDLLKTARLATNPHKRDSWVDKAGYTGCGAECALGGDNDA